MPTLTKNRGARIRTGDLLLPKQARYRTAPRPVNYSSYWPTKLADDSVASRMATLTVEPHVSENAPSQYHVESSSVSNVDPFPSFMKGWELRDFQFLLLLEEPTESRLNQFGHGASLPCCLLLQPHHDGVGDIQRDLHSGNRIV